MTFSFLLSKPSYLAAASRLCASRKEKRYYLQGVYIEPRKNGGVCLVTGCNSGVGEGVVEELQFEHRFSSQRRDHGCFIIGIDKVKSPSLLMT